MAKRVIPVPVRPQPYAAIDALEQARDTPGLVAAFAAALSLLQRRRVVRALAHVGNYRAVPALLRALHDPDRLIRYAAAEGLGRLGEEGTAVALVALLADPDPQVRRVAADALGRFNTEAAFATVLAALAHPDRHTRQGAALALGTIADRRATSALITRLGDESGTVRAAAATALGQIGDHAAVEPLERQRHKSRHPAGQDCTECAAIAAALARLRRGPDMDGGAVYAS